jgi:putative membrane protein
VMYFGDHMSGWGWVYMGLGTVLFWAVLITGIVLLVRYLNESRQSSPSSRTAQQVLAERFACGEIDETEYQQRLALLREQVRS